MFLEFEEFPHELFENQFSLNYEVSFSFSCYPSFGASMYVAPCLQYLPDKRLGKVYYVVQGMH